MTKTWMLVSIILEVIGVAAIGAGIGVEVIAHADAGWITLSAGSWLVAAGGIVWGKFLRGGKG